MAEVKILLEGYASGDGGDDDSCSCSTVTLVRDGDIVMIVDPGTLKDRKLLTDALAKEGLSVDDVSVVFITHSHMDHFRNIGMFPKAKAIDHWGWWSGDEWSECNGKVTEDIEILKTPGHSGGSVTLFVKTSKGIVAICGDVFWKENYPEKDPYATNPAKLEKSRKIVLEKADWVIPGHGPMFRSS
ncbi:MAG: MBL fold metallo-hydrolase [Candidatus Aenigmarchaeota archaeon]|nr:MBL fold metallo-hydrolase [Candidatus Aenigmarchaeota archaeon]